MSSPLFSAPIVNPFGLDTVNSWAAPSCVDSDGDGDFYDRTADVVYGNVDTDPAPGFSRKVLGPATLVIGDFSSVWVAMQGLATSKREIGLR